MILIIGGRSKIGAALIGELLGRGQRVRALVRAGEPVGRVPVGAEEVTGDLADEGSLARTSARTRWSRPSNCPISAAPILLRPPMTRINASAPSATLAW